MKTQSSADRITTSLNLDHQRKIKQTNEKPQHISHPIQAYTIHWTKLRKAETKRKKEFNLEGWGKETSNTIRLKKIIKRQRNTTHMKEQPRNTEIQINEEEIGKLTEKNSE